MVRGKPKKMDVNRVGVNKENMGDRIKRTRMTDTKYLEKRVKEKNKKNVTYLAKKKKIK